MPALVGDIAGQERLAGDVQVANGVQDLVLDELVVVAQAVAVEHAVVIDNDDVVHVAAQAEAAGAHHLHVLGEAEGAGACDVALVDAGGKVELDAPAGGVHGGVVELDLEAELVAVEGLQPGPLQRGANALADLHRFPDADETLGRVLHFDAGVLQQEDEAGRAAIEDGHFVACDVDAEVVDAQPRAGRHQVFDGLHLGRAGVAAGADGAGHARVADGKSVDGDVHRRGQVGAAEDHAGVRCGGPQRQLHLLAAVHTHANGTGQGLESALPEHAADCQRSVPIMHWRR